MSCQKKAHLGALVFVAHGGGGGKEPILGGSVGKIGRRLLEKPPKKPALGPVWATGPPIWWGLQKGLKTKKKGVTPLCPVFGGGQWFVVAGAHLSTKNTRPKNQ